MKGSKINILYLSSFLMSFSYGVLLTLPLFLNKYFSLPVSFAGEVISMGVLGVFPTILLLPKLYSFIRNSRLISLGALIYAVGVALVIKGNAYLYYVAGLLFGVGWGMVHTLGPIIISQLRTDKNRANNFSYISAFNMLGTGLAPVLVRYLDVNNIPFYHTYRFTFLLALLSSVLFLFCSNKTIHSNVGKENALTLSSREILSSSAIVPMIMVFMGACIFSSMMNFQSFFAGSKGLNFSYFYLSYTFAVIFCRFSLTKIVNSFPKELIILLLLIVMFLSLFLIKFVDSNFYYILPSALLGFSYGLVYPLIQNHSVKNAKSEAQRKKNLTFFSLFYFIGVYLFPYVYSLVLSGFGFSASLNLLLIISMAEIFFSLFLFKASAK